MRNDRDSDSNFPKAMESVEEHETAIKEGYMKGKLPPSLARSLFDKIRDKVPDWLLGPFREKERGLVLMERRIQRRFLHEYHTQVKEVGPVLRARGVLVGTAIKEALLGNEKSEKTYQEAENDTNIFQSAKTKEILKNIDPLIRPVMDPFVEGVQEPINLMLRDIERDLKLGFAATATVSLLSGILLGKFLYKKKDE